LYLLAIALLLVVEIKGYIGKGAQRWLELGGINIQPSEIVKIALVLVLAHYFSKTTEHDLKFLPLLIIPFILLAIPTFLVLHQPDLGTTIILILTGLSIFFAAGTPLWLFLTGGGIIAASTPFIWQFGLHDYQKQRILTFLDPSKDPLHSGYHVLQSQIALGSGGLWGKGFLEGTQSHLNFVPEKQTDFIFTIMAEEFGFVGSTCVLGLYLLILFYGYWFAFHCKHSFGRLIALGLSTNLFGYMFVNIGMVAGLLPVVGEPLPLLSYGGSSMITTVIAFGFILNSYVYSDEKDYIN
jgi:rod shape determining protein RodA